MILTDGARRLDIAARDVPPFPEDLDEQYQAKVLAAREPDEQREFRAFWAKVLERRGWAPHWTPEDIVHMRRMLGKHGLANMKAAVQIFFGQYSEWFETNEQASKRAPQMRVFAHFLPEVMVQVERWADGE